MKLEIAFTLLLLGLVLAWFDITHILLRIEERLKKSSK